MWALNIENVIPLSPADVCSLAFFQPLMCSSVETGGVLVEEHWVAVDIVTGAVRMDQRTSMWEAQRFH